MAKEVTRVSSFAAKTTMALTGTVFTLFVLVHMVGNLKVYGGPDEFNAYAHWLRFAFSPVLPPESLLWALRILLLLCLLAHVWCGVLLWLRARRARGRHRPRLNLGRWASATMLPTGLVLLAFIGFHLLDLTTGHLGAEFRPATADQSFAYQNLVASFSRPWAGGIYLATMLVLAMHLGHGIWTACHDVGATGARARAIGKILALLVPLLVALGNASIPISVWTGVLS